MGNAAGVRAKGETLPKPPEQPRACMRAFVRACLLCVQNNTTMMSIKYVCGELRPTGVTNITELVEALQSGDTDSDGRSGVHPLLLSAGDTLDREEGLC
eukprot:5579523-Ditylum_brightwellii.AAC.1